MTVLDNLLLGRHIRMQRSWLAGLLGPGPQAEEIANRRAVEDIIDFLEIEKWRKHPVACCHTAFRSGSNWGGPGHGARTPFAGRASGWHESEETEDMAPGSSSTFARS
ncbi:MAG: hypothetical protein Ct9H300mP12_12130 [Acidimicrobiales bacterium]|nr:MAG: hypothetical protein Ct9H300mP12_12130 [Acidimicrobiales bacterium]